MSKFAVVDENGILTNIVMGEVENGIAIPEGEVNTVISGIYDEVNGFPLPDVPQDVQHRIDIVEQKLLASIITTQWFLPRVRIKTVWLLYG